MNYSSIYLRDLLKKLKESDHIVGFKIDYNTESDKVDGNSILNFEKLSNVDFHEIVFTNCLFEIPIWFINMEINGLFCFENCIFNSRVIFNRVNFKSEFLFRGNTFTKEVNFSQCQFNNPNFLDNNFNGNLLFDPYPNRAPNVMNGVAIFKSSFNNYTSFRWVEFEEVNFEYSNIGLSLFEFTNCSVSRMGLFRRINFGSKVTFDGIDLTSFSFLFSNFKEVNFLNCKINFSKNLDEVLCGFIKDREIEEYIKLKEESDPFIEDNDVSKEYKDPSSYFRFTLENLLDVYRKFEINFDSNKEYEKAGEFHFRRFEVNRIESLRIFKSNLSLLREIINLKKLEGIKFGSKTGKKVNQRWQQFLYKLERYKNRDKSKLLKLLLLSLYKWSSDYGENYKKTLVWFGIFFLVFAITYMLFGLIYNGNYRNLEIVINNFSWGKLIEDFNISLLYSFNNAIPLKKDLEYLKSANIYTSFFSILETFIQTILAALFVIGLRRKFKR